MSGLVKPSWFSYALSGALALLASWALSGCYFGNRTVNQPATGDSVSGYYETQPQTLQYFASAPAEKRVDVATNQIPTDYSSIFTNPVLFEIQDSASGAAGIFPYPTSSNSYGIGVTLGNAQAFGTNQSAAGTLWDDPACTREDEEGIDGSYKKSSGPWTSNTPEIIKSGRVQFTLDYTISFIGSCAASLQAMANCYNDATQCGSHSQSDVQSLFEPFITAGAMAATDIPNLTDLGYEMSYQ